MRLPPRFETERLVIRPFRVSDFALWSEAFAGRRPKIERYELEVDDESIHSRAAYAARVKKYQKLARVGLIWVAGAFHRESGELIGRIDIGTIQRGPTQWANLGYAIFNQYYGNGYGREAARAGLELGFKHLGFHRIEAAINLDNRRSIRLARAIGMRRECVRRAFLLENGKWTDHVIYVTLGGNSL